MLFYITLIILIIFSTLKCSNKKVGIFWIVTLCFLSMFRAETVGTDTTTYMNFSENINKFTSDSGDGFNIGGMIEFSYLTIVIFLYQFELSPRILIILMSCISFLFLFLTLKRLKLSYNIGILIFFLVFYIPSLNIARQICACCIILYAYTFLFERGKLKYLFFTFIAIATSFHASSILYLALYLFRYNMKFYKKSLFFFALGFLFINMVYPLPISEWITSSFGSMTYSKLYSDRSVTQARSIFGILYTLMHFSAYFIIFFKYSSYRLNKMDLIFYCSIIALIISSTAHSDFARIFLPLNFFQIIYICTLFKLRKLKLYDYPFIYYILINVILVTYSLAMGAGEVIPYKIELNL